MLNRTWRSSVQEAPESALREGSSASGLPVTVLEARDRMGGRTVTRRFKGHPLDLGAHWLHAGPINPLVKLGRPVTSPCAGRQSTAISSWPAGPAAAPNARPSTVPSPWPTGR